MPLVGSAWSTGGTASERRAKVINAEGEFQAAAKLAEAVEVLARHPIAVRRRYLQTMREVASEPDTTTFFPLPIDLFTSLLQAFGARLHPRADPPPHSLLVRRIGLATKRQGASRMG